MATISPIPPFPELADRAAGTYNSKAYAFGTHMGGTFPGEMNAVAGEVSANAGLAQSAVIDAAEQVALANTAALAASGSAKYRGDYSAAVLYAVGDSASYAGATYAKKTTAPAGTTPANGTHWLDISLPNPGPRNYTVAQYAASATFTVPAGCKVIRPYAFGAGAEGTTSASGGGGGCAYGDIAVTPGSAVTLSISAGKATVTYGGVVLLTANNAVGTTAGTASKHASVTNGGAYSGGAGAGAKGGGASSGSPLGNGVSSGGSAGSGGSGWGSAGGAGGLGGGGGVGAAPTYALGGAGLAVPSTDPLLFGLVGLGGGPGDPGQPGGGGGGNNGSNNPSGAGGFGGGGGGASGAGGNGGFGGGGGGSSSSIGGIGGFGGGGGGGNTGGVGGAAVIRIYY